MCQWLLRCDQLYQPSIQLRAIKLERTLRVLYKNLSDFTNDNTRGENQSCNGMLISDKVREPMEINNHWWEIDNEVTQSDEIRGDTTRVHRELTRIGAGPEGFIANIVVHNRVCICGMRWLRHVGETIIRAATCGESTGANDASPLVSRCDTL